MMKTTLLTCHLILFFGLPALALEPGLLRNEELFKKEPSLRIARPKEPDNRHVQSAVAPGPVNMAEEFGRGAGLTETKLRDMHYSRVACSRRMYSRNGYSVEGDADVKATAVSEDLYEVEFPARIYLKRFDPYQSGIQEIESEVSLQLVRFTHWVKGSPLKLRKTVKLVFNDPNRRDQRVTAIDEVRVLEDVYPPRYIIRETVIADREYEFYFICQ